MTPTRSRREVAAGLAALAGTLTAAGSAASQSARTLSLVVAFPAGSPPDLLARILAPYLAEVLGRSVVVDNRSGAGGNIGTAAVAKAPADESLLLVSSNGPLSTNKVIYPRLPYDPDHDLDPVSILVASPLLLVVDPKLPIRSLAEFVSQARREPGRLSYATAGIGTTSHVTMEALKRRDGLNIVHVPYRSTPAATNDLLGGRVQVMWGIASGVLPLVQEGKLRAVAISSAGRLMAAPDIPTVGEQGYPELEGSAWFAMMAPAGTPSAHVSAVHAAVVRKLRQPDVRDSLEKQGYEIVASNPAEARGYIERDNRVWTPVIEAANIRVTE